MDLEDLKTIWRVQIEAPPPGPDLLEKKSQGIVAGMKRNLHAEAILVLAIYTPVILLYFFGFEGRLTLLGWILTGLVLLFILYYYKKKRLLERMEFPGDTMRENLRRNIAALLQYIRFYTLAGTVLVPIMAMVSLVVTEKGFGLRGSAWVWAPALIPLTVATYYTNSWFANKQYGHHLRRLRHLLEEMDEMDNM